MAQRGRKSAALLSVLPIDPARPQHDPSEPATVRPPSDLLPEVQQWWAQITSEYGFSPAELSLLRNAAESYQRKVEAAAAIKKHGAVFTDEKGMIRSRPEIQHERDARAAFVRTLKLLNLDRPAKPYNGPQPRALFDND